MKPRRSIVLASALLPSLGVGILAQEKPNVVIINIDDMGIGDLSCYGGPYPTTTNIDNFANEGIRFTQFYSAAPVSSPSRCGLLTGMFPIENGINTFEDTRAANKNVEQLDYLNPNAPSMVRAFQNAGYATAHIGKWHLGGGRDVMNAPSLLEYGYDQYLSTYESPDPDPAITATNWIWSAQDSVKRWKRTEYFVDKSIDFISKHKDGPFFLNLWPDDMHTPWVPEALANDNGSWQTQPAFEPVLTELDKQLGRFFHALDSLGVTENTIVILTSDNGPAPSFKQGRTLEFRGQKNSLYEGGINMPFIIRYPKKINAGKVNDSSVICTVDLYLSLCAMAGIDTEPGYESDGEDMSKELLGESDSSRTKDLMWDFGRNSYFNFPADSVNRSPHLAIRRGDWKLLVNDNGADAELYDLSVDKNETTNVASEHQDLVNELSQKVCDWYNTYRAKELAMIDSVALAENKACLKATVEIVKDEAEGKDFDISDAMTAAQEALGESSTASQVTEALNNLRIARKKLNTDRQENEYKGSEPEESGEYYLYNVGQRRFLCGGNKWGAHASLGFPGWPVKLVKADNGFIIDTRLQNGNWKGMWEPDGDSHYFNYKGFLDTAIKSVWKFIKREDGGYNIARADDTTKLVGYVPTTFSLVNTDMPSSPATNAAASLGEGKDSKDNIWMFITKEERDSLLNLASENHPVDASYLIGMPNFNQREYGNKTWRQYSGWEMTDSSEGGACGIWDRTGDHPDFALECWNDSSAFKLEQTINDLPEGIYRITVQGFYRDGYPADYVKILTEGKQQSRPAYLYSNTQEVLLPTLDSENNNAPGEGWSNKAGEFPTNVNQACTWFRDGLYKVSIIDTVNVDDNNKLKIGIRKFNKKSGDWLVVDNFRITYLGPTTASGIRTVTQESVSNQNMYNLAGQRVDDTYKGIIIKNSRKVVNK